MFSEPWFYNKTHDDEYLGKQIQHTVSWFLNKIKSKENNKVDSSKVSWIPTETEQCHNIKLKRNTIEHEVVCSKTKKSSSPATTRGKDLPKRVYPPEKHIHTTYLPQKVNHIPYFFIGDWFSALAYASLQQ